jgi:cellulose synthase/poly-beta-1,6-N-acetylglucosamine synthase-like glycosyltransferase
MRVLLISLFIINSFIIFWAMIGYPLSLRIINKFKKERSPEIDKSYEPTVTIMIVAHNEEKVIGDKLLNVIKVNYPKDKLEILISSDNSTDKTNEIVRRFINNHQEYSIRLYEVKERKGKTNAQNEAAATVKSEILVMTDANAMLDQNSIRELVSEFSVDEIAYVTGRLMYINEDKAWTSKSESSYWEWDLKMREIESNIHSVTAGNGALYACRTKEYYNFNPIRCHDSAMPVHYVLQGKRAVYNKNAIAYEKAGEKVEDEFGRKIRMSRSILNAILPDIKVLNIFKYKWFSYCYFGHRYCRRNLWLAHLLVLLLNIPLAFINTAFTVILILQRLTLYLLFPFCRHNLFLSSDLYRMEAFAAVSVFLLFLY